MARAILRVEPGVIRQRAHTLGHQKLRGLIHALAALTIHNAAFPFVRANEGEDLPTRVTALPLLARGNAQIRPEK